MEIESMFRDNGKYDLGHRLGRGTYGEVYSMIEKDSDDPLPFVVKVCDLDRDGTCGFSVLREIVPLAILGPRYPRLFPRIVATNKFDKRIHIIMERYDSDALAFIEKNSLFRDPGAVVSMACCMAIQGLRALRVLHHCGIAHRDVKTSNFLIKLAHPPAMHRFQGFQNKRMSSQSNFPTMEQTMLEKLGLSEIVLADFSLAKKLRVLNSREVMTPGYCAPETPEGMHGTTSSYGCKVDVYSLGCTLFEVLTGGKFLPEGPDPIRMLKLHLKNQYKSIGTNMSILVGLIEDMLHPNPSCRPSTDSLLSTYTKALFKNGFFGMGEELSTRHRLTTVQLSENIDLSKLKQICERALDLLHHIDSDLRNESISLFKYFIMRYGQKTETNFFTEELKDTSPDLWICVCYFLVWSYYVGDGRSCKAISLEYSSKRHNSDASRKNNNFVKFAVCEHLFDYDTFIKAYWVVIRMTSFRILFDNRQFIFHE